MLGSRVNHCVAIRGIGVKAWIPPYHALRSWVQFPGMALPPVFGGFLVWHVRQHVKTFFRSEKTLKNHRSCNYLSVLSKGVKPGTTPGRFWGSRTFTSCTKP